MNNMDSLVEAYLTIRGERERIQAEYETTDRELKNQLQILEQEMLAGCNAVNASSIKTSSGTVIKSLKERYTCSDRDNFNKFVLENNAVELFEGRIHQGNFKEFMTDRHGDGLPPGVNVTREFTITVRKPTVKNDFN